MAKIIDAEKKVNVAELKGKIKEAEPPAEQALAQLMQNGRLPFPQLLEIETYVRQLKEYAQLLSPDMS